MAGDSRLRQDPKAGMGSEIGSEFGHESGDVVRFEYPEGGGAVFEPTWEGWDDPAGALAIDGAGPLDSTSTGSRPSDSRADSQPENPADSDSPDAQSSLEDSGSDTARLLGEERAFETGFEAGRRKGIEEAREEARVAEAQVQIQARAQFEQRRIAQLTAALESFAGERVHFLKAAEGVVVKLALAVAARILRREAALDPLLLSGAVRVALGQIAGSTEVRLRVPAAELAMWKEAMATMPNLAARPAVMAGEGMELGDCVIETALGRADLGIGSQLAEVERVLLEQTAATAAPVKTTRDKKTHDEERVACESAA